jgi:hypothetical protein
MEWDYQISFTLNGKIMLAVNKGRVDMYSTKTTKLIGNFLKFKDFDRSKGLLQLEFSRCGRLLYLVTASIKDEQGLNWDLFLGQGPNGDYDLNRHIGHTVLPDMTIYIFNFRRKKVLRKTMKIKKPIWHYNLLYK